jgi:hypothetical protein
MINSSQRPLRENTQQSQQTNIHAPGGIQTNDLSRRSAADLRLRPRGHLDRHIFHVHFNIIMSSDSRLLKCYLLIGFKTETLYTFSVSPMSTRCPTHLIILNSNFKISDKDNYKVPYYAIFCGLLLLRFSLHAICRHLQCLRNKHTITAPLQSVTVFFTTEFSTRFYPKCRLRRNKLFSNTSGTASVSFHTCL